MKAWVKVFAFLISLGLVSLGCGKDEKSSAERDAEMKKALQEGMQKEKQMYEGMQKGMEAVEKSVQEQKEKAKK